jgi:hypothetical protein
MQTPKKPGRRLPFQNMPSGAWINLALVAVVIFYGLRVFVDQKQNKLCLNLAVDYCAYWSAGQLASAHGYAGMYDQSLMARYQAPLYPSQDDPSTPARIIPFPYFPVYVLPFQLFALLDLHSSFLIYTLLNLLGLILYLRFFFKNLTGQPLPVRLLLMSVLSMPVFLNLFWGQANIFLGICVGEFLRAHLNHKSYRSGLWLGGLLFKPLLLILIIPALLIQRSYRALIGFLVILAGMLLSTYLMIGTTGIQNLFDILFASAQGGSASNPAIMMNWRMLGFHLTTISSATLDWVVIIIGTLITAGATWLIARRSFMPDRFKTTAALLGIFAATGAISWHAHFPQSLVLLPFFVFLSFQNRPAWHLFQFWTFTPILLTLFAYILAIATDLSPGVKSAINLQIGFTGLILNLVVLSWAVYTCTQAKLADKHQTI